MLNGFILQKRKNMLYQLTILWKLEEPYQLSAANLRSVECVITLFGCLCIICSLRFNIFYGLNTKERKTREEHIVLINFFMSFIIKMLLQFL